MEHDEERMKNTVIEIQTETEKERTFKWRMRNTEIEIETETEKKTYKEWEIRKKIKMKVRKETEQKDQ